MNSGRNSLIDRFGPDASALEVPGDDAYDRRREVVQPMQLNDMSGNLDRQKNYGWSEPRLERQDFGAYVRRSGFRLD